MIIKSESLVYKMIYETTKSEENRKISIARNITVHLSLLSFRGRLIYSFNFVSILTFNSQVINYLRAKKKNYDVPVQ